MSTSFGGHLFFDRYAPIDRHKAAFLTARCHSHARNAPFFVAPARAPLTLVRTIICRPRSSSKITLASFYAGGRNDPRILVSLRVHVKLYTQPASVRYLLAISDLAGGFKPFRLSVQLKSL